jgi:hypothetical protein
MFFGLTDNDPINLACYYDTKFMLVHLIADS